MPGMVHRDSGDSSVRGQREGQWESVLDFPKLEHLFFSGDALAQS